jgi:putative Holliday junction resolvase
MRRRRVISIDLGEKNVGVAVSDELGITAQGLTCLKRRGEQGLLDELCRVIREKEARLVVVGHPVKMSGEVGPKAREAEEFAEKLRQCSGIEVSLWDERLTTKQAERAMLEGDLSRNKRKKRRDIIAAQLILQSFLDSQARSTATSHGVPAETDLHPSSER